MSSKPKQSEESRKLEQMAIEREKQLRVENARETTKAFSDNLAFRQKLRGIFSLLSGGFKGFTSKLGVGGGRPAPGNSSASGILSAGIGSSTPTGSGAP